MSEVEKDHLITEIKPNAYVSDDGEIHVKINIYEMFEYMHEEQLEIFAEHFGWGYVLREALKRLGGDSDSWGYGDDELRLRFLANVIDKELGYTTWSSLLELSKAAKQMQAYEKLYRSLHNDEEHYKFFRKWLDENGYSSMTYKEDVTEFNKKIDDTFSNLGSQFKAMVKELFGYNFLNDDDYRELSPTKKEIEDGSN